MLETSINVELQKEQFDKLLNKLIQRRPDPAPKIKVSIKLDSPAYKSRSPPLEVKFSTDYVKFLSKSSLITLFFTASTADTGAQVIILGHNHLESIGLKILCLYKMSTVLDCANSTVTGAMGVFNGCMSSPSNFSLFVENHFSQLNMPCE